MGKVGEYRMVSGVQTDFDAVGVSVRFVFRPTWFSELGLEFLRKSIFDALFILKDISLRDFVRLVTAGKKPSRALVKGQCTSFPHFLALSDSSLTMSFGAERYTLFCFDRGWKQGGRGTVICVVSVIGPST